MLDGQPTGLFRRAHGPTWLAAATIYGGWITLTLEHERIPLPLLFVLGGIVLAWHGSLQHETIHGHPAGPRWVGRALGAPPLSLWLPYEIYRDTHRRHHATHRLADTHADPEAPLAAGTSWQARAHGTALGRLVLGPFLVIATSLASELAALGRGESRYRKAWLLHATLVAAVLAWLVLAAHMPLWKYLLAFVHPGTSLTLLRSFAEHRVDEAPDRRTTVVETGLFFRMLFLNNNYHIAHHAAPRAPWFELPRIWARQRTAAMARAPELVHDGYLPLIRKRLLRP